jgi:hypothetical protein
VFRPKITLPATGVKFMKIIVFGSLINHKETAGFKDTVWQLTVRTVKHKNYLH